MPWQRVGGNGQSRGRAGSCWQETGTPGLVRRRIPHQLKKAGYISLDSNRVIIVKPSTARAESVALDEAREAIAMSVKADAEQRAQVVQED